MAKALHLVKTSAVWAHLPLAFVFRLLRKYARWVDRNDTQFGLLPEVLVVSTIIVLACGELML